MMSGSVFFSTKNSAYEVNVEGKLIRRLAGINQPTERQGKDMEWQPFVSISEIREGVGVLIGWRWEGHVLKCTETSPVKEVLDWRKVD